jgi:transketolase
MSKSPIGANNMAVVLADNRESRKAIRDGFGTGLVDAAAADERVVGLCADVTDSIRMGDFRDAYPERFFQLGVHEQLLVAASAGLAVSGKKPFCGTYAMFSPGRSWEMVRTNVCLNEANVVVVGSHAGLNVGPDGATHQALEDIAITRVLPHMTVVVPCDAQEAHKATLALAAQDGPAYLRLTRDKVGMITACETPFELGKAEVFRDGDDCAIIACGLMVEQALTAAEQMAADGGPSCRVINCHTIKPLDQKTILAAAKECGRVVTAEEHQLAGGLGSAVAELLSVEHPTPMAMVGVDDQFGESGTAQELLDKHGLNAAGIIAAVNRLTK